jgi:hypothetical protein
MDADPSAELERGIDRESASVPLRHGAIIVHSRPGMETVSGACIQKVKRRKAMAVGSPVDWVTLLGWPYWP